MTINYKGFELEVEVYNNSLTIEKVEGSLTNQIALLTSAFTLDADKIGAFTIELDYKYYLDYDFYGNHRGAIDLAIDIDKWLLINPSMQQKVLIELLMEEELEILEQLTETV